MRRRVLAASAGAGAGAGLLGALLATWTGPAPRGVLLVVVLLGLLVPAVGSLGAAIGLRVMGADHVGDAARLTAVGAPMLALLALFAVDVVDPAPAGGAQQLTALVVGTIGAAGLAARFSGPPEGEG